MPTYVFRNTETGELIEKQLGMSEVKDSMEIDGVLYERDLTAQIRGFNAQRSASKANSLWPKKSISCGVPPSQVSKDGRYKDPKARRKFPNHKFDNKGRMVFDSRSQMKRHMKDIGMEHP